MVSSQTRWSVIWFSKKKKRLIETTFGDDLPAALTLFEKASRANKPVLTLRCCNVGWAPPPHLRPFTKKVKRKIGKKTIIEEVDVTPMHALNLKGAWWCPYCMKLRKFRKQMTVTSPATNTPMNLPGYYCPVCGTSHRDGQVQKHNPIARSVEYTLTTRRPRARATRIRRATR